MEQKNKNTYFHGGHIGDVEAALYVTALLEENVSSLPGPVLEHVEACPECKNKILDLFLFMKNPDTSEAPPRGEVVEMPVRETRRFYLRKAAAAVFVFAIIFAAYFLVYKNGFFTGADLRGVKDDTALQQVVQGQTEPGGETPGKEAGVTKEGDKDAVAKKGRVKTPPNYRVNPNLEIMIGSQSRSAVVRIHSPLNNVYLKGDILFSWEGVGVEPLRLKILNNRNDALFEYTAEGNRVVFKEKLRPGLYYWKLESKTDLLYVGKFFIK